jgi:hypothetical protein
MRRQPMHRNSGGECGDGGFWPAGCRQEQGVALNRAARSRLGGR